MLSNILTLLIILVLHGGTASAADFPKPGTPGKPLSMEGDGYAATVFWLSRSERTAQSKTGTRGHFYKEIIFNGEAFPVQVTSFSPVTALAGVECELKCDIEKKLTNTKQYSGIPTTLSFKNFLQRTSKSDQNVGGFKASSFMGRYTKSTLDLDDPYKNSHILEPNFPVFTIFHPTNSDESYVQNQSGVMGLGIPSYQNDKLKEYSWLHLLRESGKIAKEQVYYNITFKPDEWEHVQDSYIQLGSIEKTVLENTTWLPTETWDSWGSNVQFSFFRHKKKVYPFLEFQATAVFDPQVDYLYVNGMEFENMITPVLKTMYGDDLGCTTTECYFLKTCDVVRKEYEHAGLQFALGPKDKYKEQVQIHLDLVNYLVPGPELSDSEQYQNYCFLPIFVTDPDKNVDAALTWFLGNMFMDRYFIINDFEEASREKNIKPRIGIYDKWHPNSKPFIPDDGKNPFVPKPDPEKEKEKEKEKGDDQTNGGQDGTDPIIEPKPDEEGGGAGTFWTIFLILFFLGGAGVLVKLYGKQCLEKVEEYRNGGGTGGFQTGQNSYDPEIVYSGNLLQDGQPAQNVLPTVDPAPEKTQGDAKSRLKFDD